MFTKHDRRSNKQTKQHWTLEPTCFATQLSFEQCASSSSNQVSTREISQDALSAMLKIFKLNVLKLFAEIGALPDKKCAVR